MPRYSEDVALRTMFNGGLLPSSYVKMRFTRLVYKYNLLSDVAQCPQCRYYQKRGT